MKGWLFLFLLCAQGCSGLFYYPTRVLYSNPKELGVVFENHYFESEDGTRLHGWLLPRQTETPSAGLIVFFHGNAQNITSHFFNLQWLTEHGYELFIFDYRGYGLSEGKPHQAGLVRDGRSAIEYAMKLQKEREAPHLIAYGQSLGGNVLMRVLEDFAPEQFSFTVLDSTFPSYQRIAALKLKTLWPLIWLRPFVPLLVSDEYAPRQFFAKWTGPILVIRGEQDPVVEPVWSQEIYDRLLTERKWFWSIPEGKHIDAYFVDNKRWRRELVELFEEEL